MQEGLHNSPRDNIFVYLQSSLFKVTKFVYYKRTTVIGLNTFGGFFIVPNFKHSNIGIMSSSCKVLLGKEVNYINTGGEGIVRFTLIFSYGNNCN